MDGAPLQRLKGIMSPEIVSRGKAAWWMARACCVVAVLGLAGLRVCISQEPLPPLPANQQPLGPLPLVPVAPNPFPPTPQPPLAPATPSFQLPPAPFLQAPAEVLPQTPPASGLPA